MLRVQREYGWDATVEVVAKILVQLDVACGGNGMPAKCEMWAAQILARPDIKGRSLGYLIVALRDGISRVTIHDKRLGMEQINKMLNQQDEEIMRSLPGDEEVGDSALKGEQLRMDRNEEERGRIVARLSNRVRALEEKLQAERQRRVINLAIEPEDPTNEGISA